MVLGHILTALPVINAIPAIVAAPPGIITYEDIPIPKPMMIALTAPIT